MNSYEGAFFLQGTGVGGWACQQNNPVPLWLELLVDGEVMGIGRADHSVPDGCGFWIPLPSIALEGGETLSVRVANTGHYIGSPISLEGAQNSAPLVGECALDRGLIVSGWVRDSLEPARVLAIEALCEGEVVAETLASKRRFRPESGDSHGFTLTLPARLADGKEHVIRLQDKDKRTLPGSPLTLMLTLESLSDWIGQKNKLEAKDLVLLQSLLGHMERRLPGGCSADIDNYAAWMSAFPTPKPAGICKASLSIPFLTEKEALQLIRSQKGFEGKRSSGRAEYALFISAREKLYPFALAHMVSELGRSACALIYADSLCTSEDRPFCKPCWDPDLFWGCDYLGPFVVKGEVIDACPREPGESYACYRVRIVRYAQDMGGIRHLPYLLSEEQEALDGSERISALKNWVRSLDGEATVENQGRFARVHWGRSQTPSVSIIIPTRDHADLLKNCLASLKETDYPDYEIVLVDNGSRDEEALQCLEAASQAPNTRLLRYPGVFNYAAINNFAVGFAQGEFICFLNNDTEVLHPDWLLEMSSLLSARTDVGCVGAKLIWPNGLVQHAGVVIGTHGLAGHIGNNWLDEEPGYFHFNQLVCERSAVTAACLLTRKKLFQDLCGFDERRFPVAFNDVDYCLKVRARNMKIVWTPFARLLHRESASRGQDTDPMNKARMQREIRYFRSLWGTASDPFYNPNLPLSTVTEPFDDLAVPPRSRHAR